MPNLTQAPFLSPLVGNMTIETASAWWTWFQSVRDFIVGYSSESTTSGDLKMNTTYIANGGVLITGTIPAKFNVNDTIQVIGKGVGGWKIQLNPGQIIHGTSNTSSGGSLSSTGQYNTVTLKGITADTELAVVSFTGTLTYA